MPNHELEFHGNHLAVKVKVYIPYWTDLKNWSNRIGVDFEELGTEVENQIYELFWMQAAPDIARRFGFEGVQSEGRSNGWCIPIYGGRAVERAYLDNIMDEEATDVMKNYFQFRFNIKKLVNGAVTQLRAALIEELTTRELDFLYERSVEARTMQHVVSGAMA